MDLDIFNDFVDEMLEYNSRNYKMSVLEKYKDDAIVKTFLRFLYDPYVVTGISRKKLSKKVPYTRCRYSSALELLNYVASSKTGSDEVIAQVWAFVDHLDENLTELMLRLVIKDLPLGIEVLSINKVMPKLIPTFNVQLANKYFDNPQVVEGKEFYVTTKIDGGRIIAMKRDGAVSFYTRAGQLYEGLVDLEQEMSDFMPDDIVLDGEITLLDSKGLDNKQQYKQTMMITRKNGVKHGVKMKVFDIMSADEFSERQCTTPYKDRRRKLEELFMSDMFKYFELLPVLYHGSDTSVIRIILDEQVSKGEEGVMINLADAPYSFDRGNALLKVKKMKDVDLVVKGFEEGNNQNAGKLGAFVVDYKGNDLRVGSGMSKELRKQVWDNKEDYLGMTIVVQYFEETTNQQGGKSLRFPVFVDFRTDK